MSLVLNDFLCSVAAAIVTEEGAQNWTAKKLRNSTNGSGINATALGKLGSLDMSMKDSLLKKPALPHSSKALLS